MTAAEATIEFAWDRIRALEAGAPPPIDRPPWRMRHAVHGEAVAVDVVRGGVAMIEWTCACGAKHFALAATAPASSS